MANTQASCCMRAATAKMYSALALQTKFWHCRLSIVDSMHSLVDCPLLGEQDSEKAGSKIIADQHMYWQNFKAVHHLLQKHTNISISLCNPVWEMEKARVYSPGTCQRMSTLGSAGAVCVRQVWMSHLRAPKFLAGLGAKCDQRWNSHSVDLRDSGAAGWWGSWSLTLLQGRPVVLSQLFKLMFKLKPATWADSIWVDVAINNDCSGMSRMFEALLESSTEQHCMHIERMLRSLMASREIDYREIWAAGLQH